MTTRANSIRHVAALGLQRAGDLIVDPKTVLAWLLAGLGAPAAAIALLVPVRESGSMLPQAGLLAVVRRQPVRRWFWVAGALGQATCVVAMAALAAFTEGAAAGWGILAVLAGFAVARSLSSLASKDVMGRTIPKGRRGRVTGSATAAAGFAAITLGVGLRWLGGDDTSPITFAVLLVVAAACWVAAAAVYATIRERPGDHDPDADAKDVVSALALLRDDAVFRRFVLARGLLLVSALSPPFVVMLAAGVSGTGLRDLGPFVIATGVASLVGGRLWGGFADRSSRRTMIAACVGASAVVVAFLITLRSPTLRELALLYPATHLLLALMHTGARVGRKTYVVDLARGDDRTDRVAVSNAAMGVVLLVVGGATSIASIAGPEAALALLAVLGVVGAFVGQTLPEVSAAGA
ncbi:MAG: MFS transporter [Nitriliruptoraceae bacterium]